MRFDSLVDRGEMIFGADKRPDMFNDTNIAEPCQRRPGQLVCRLAGRVRDQMLMQGLLFFLLGGL